MNIQALIKQAQSLQKDMMNAKKELDAMEFTGESSLVTVVVKGDKTLSSVKIKELSSFDKEDVELLEDMIVVAMNDAFLISHLWFFQIPPFPNRGVLRVDGMIARAGVAMIVDDTACLEMGIHRYRAHVLEAVSLQFLCDFIGQAVADRDSSLFVPYI